MEELRDLEKLHAANSKVLESNHANDPREINQCHLEKLVPMKSGQRQLKQKHSIVVLDKNYKVIKLRDTTKVRLVDTLVGRVR